MRLASGCDGLTLAYTAMRSLIAGTGMPRGFDPMVLEIRLLGTPQIVGDDGASNTVRGHQAWALLARILLTKRPLSRREIATELFPDTEDPLGSLRWCLAALRKALGMPQFLRGDPIEPGLPPNYIFDVKRLEQGLLDADDTGDLLSGIEPRSSHEFATWLLVERERVGALIDMTLRQAAMRAMATGDFEAAIQCARKAVARDSFDEGAHILLAKGLAMAGRHDAALRHVEETEKLFSEELGANPTSALRSAARRTIASAPGGVSISATVRALLDSGLAALSAGAVDAGIDSLRRAARDAEMTADRQLHATALLELGTALVHAVRGYDDEGAILLRQAVELAKAAGYAQIAANGLTELGYVDALAGRRPAASGHLAEAASLAEDDDTLAGIHAVTGFNLVDWGRIEDGLSHYELSLEYARKAGNRRREIWSLGLGAWGHLAADDPETADRWLVDCLALVESTRWMSFRPWPVALRTETRLRQQCTPVDVRDDLEGAFALSCQLTDPCWEAAVARAIALSHAAEDDLQTASRWLEEAALRCDRETDRFVALAVEILHDRAEICRRLGLGEEADLFRRELLITAARAHMDRHVRLALQ